MLRRARVTAENWRRSGRFALVAAKCATPRLFNARVKIVRSAGHQSHAEWVKSGLGTDEAFARCANVSDADDPKFLSMEAQAERYQAAVHVEGSDGWADRLRHLLLSGAVVLKQDSGIVEWWEPLLAPYVHYVPVASDLANLSAAVQWVRTHPDEAAAIARRAGELVERVLSTAALAEYAAVVLEGYAALDAAHRPRQPEVVRGHHVRFACELRGESLDCEFQAVRPSAG